MRREAYTAVVIALVLLVTVFGCATPMKNRAVAVRVPPVVTIGVQPLPLTAAFVVPDPVKNAVHREQVWCAFSTMNLAIHVGPALEKGALQALPQALSTVEVVRDKKAAASYDIVIEPSAPDIKLTTGCHWLPWERATQQAKVLLHVLVTARTGETLLDKTYTSEPHAKESAGDAVGDAYAEILEAMVHHLASSPKMRAYAQMAPALDLPAAAQGTGQDESVDRVLAGVGFVAGFGYVVTNYHVVAGRPQLRVHMQDTVAPATIALRDRTNDVALLRVEQAGRLKTVRQNPPASGLRLADVSRLKVGERVWAVAMGAADQDHGTLAEGTIVATTAPGDDRRFLQVALDLPPGHSGSPLLNEHGEVIGLLVSPAEAPEGSAMPADVPRNHSLALKISYAKTLLAMLPESEFIPPSVEPVPPQSPSMLADLVRPNLVVIAGAP